MAEGVEPQGDESAGLSWAALARDALPRVAVAAGTPQFTRHLVDAIREVVPFDWWMAMIYREHANPEMLSENFTGSWRARGLTTYVGGYYGLAPFSIMSRSLDHPEVCRLGDIAPDGCLESESHRAPYASGRIGERNLLLRLPPSGRALTTLAR